MFFFLKASKYVLVPILRDWLRLEELIDLDSALCNHTSRDTYFKLIQEFPFVIEGNLPSRKVCLTQAWINWRSNRSFGFSVDSFYVNNSSLNDFESLVGNKISDITCGIRALSMDRMTSDNENAFVQLLLLCPDLINIRITNSLGINNVIATLALSGFRLTSLCLMGCWRLVDSVVEGLLRQCVNVTDLDLSHCYELTSRVMRCMAVHCRQIQRFNMQGFSMLNVTRDTLTLIHHNFSYGRLTHFIMSRLTNAIVSSLIWYCGASLVELDYANSYYVNDSIVEVPRCCPRLTKVNSSYCYTLPESYVREMSALPGLTSVDMRDLYHLSSKTVTTLASRCSSPSPVPSPSSCSSLCPPPHSALAEVIFYNSPKVSEESLLLLAQNGASSLTSLVLTSMPLTNEGVATLGTYLSGGRLKRLCLSRINNLSVESICSCLHLLGHSLTSLSLYMLPLQDDVTLQCVAQHCYQLTSFDMGFNDRITDEGMDVLCAACRDLSKINMAHNKNISNATLLSILKYLRRSITFLNVVNCHRITAEELKQFIDGAPRLRTVKTGLVRTVNFKMFTDVFVEG